MCRNFWKISCRSRDNPEKPPGNNPAGRAKQHRFHAKMMDARITMKIRNT
jgi:hypothetical protein